MMESMIAQLNECTHRAGAMPGQLRSLARFDDGAEAGQALCDELLADTDALLAISVARGFSAVAEQLVWLKWRVYSLQRPFLRAGGWSEQSLNSFERSAMIDLEDSQRRLDQVRDQAATVQTLRLGAA